MHRKLMADRHRRVVAVSRDRAVFWRKVLLCIFLAAMLMWTCGYFAFRGNNNLSLRTILGGAGGGGASPHRSGGSVALTVFHGRLYGDATIDPAFIPANVEFVAPRGLRGAAGIGGPAAATRPWFTENELLERYQYVDLVYTWINGTEESQYFRKLRASGRTMSTDFSRGYADLGSLFRGANIGVSSRDRENGEFRCSVRSVMENMRWNSGRIFVVTPGHLPEWVDKISLFLSKSHSKASTFQVLKTEEAASNSTLIRFLKQLKSLIPRLVPKSLRRMTFIHQDALLPVTNRLTMNSNTVEAHLHRIPTLSSNFIFMNDDYMVARKSKVTDFFNPLGGPILLFESNVIVGGQAEFDKCKDSGKQIWICEVWHTVALLREMLGPMSVSNGSTMTHQHDDFDPSAKRAHQGVNSGETPSGVSQPTTENLRFATRYFLKHAPFVYSRNILEYIWRKLRDTLLQNGERNFGRHGTDVLIPFLHHTIALEAPWRAVEPLCGPPDPADERDLGIRTEVAMAVNDSSHVCALLQAGGGGAHHGVVMTPKPFGTEADTFHRVLLDERLNAMPAIGKFGASAQSSLVIFGDDLEDNKKRFLEIRADPSNLFFTINDGFQSPMVTAQTRSFLESTFNTSTPYERAHFPVPPEKQRGGLAPSPNVRADALKNLFWFLFGVPRGALIDAVPEVETLLRFNQKTPIGIPVTHVEHVCPALRSLEFAFPLFRGEVYFMITSWPESAAVTIESPTGFTTGLGSPNVRDWVTPCHPRDEKVHLNFLGLQHPNRSTESEAGANDAEILKTLEERFAGMLSTKPQDPKSVKSRNVDDDVRLEYFWLAEFNPVLGQTISLEDITFRYSPTDSDLNKGKMVVGEIRMTDMATVGAPTAREQLRTYALPYWLYELIPPPQRGG